MAAYEDSYKSQLQGVSQQVARERLEGQVSEQVNMLSDPVTNIRRRPGAVATWSVDVGAATQPTAYEAWETVVGSIKCQVLVDSKTGVVRVYSSDNTLLYTSAEIPYLQTTASTLSADLADASAIQHASIAGDVFLANTLKIPALGAVSAVETSKHGFAWVAAGAFNKTYQLSVNTAGFGLGVEYTTPDGATPGDAALSTADYIAGRLAALVGVMAGITVTVAGSTIYVQGSTDPVYVLSQTGASYVVTSTRGLVRSEADLPIAGPAVMDGYLVAVGGSTSRRYYRYVHANKEWLESGDAASPLSLTNCPIALTYTAGIWAIDTSVFEGRLSGDEDTNPVPAFVGNGITGLSSYQGRLVILAGDACLLSASNQPRRFYRSTVLSLLDSDTISVRSSGTTAATFRHAIMYNKDLILFSEKNQATLPGSTVAVSPRTAALLPTSQYTTDTGMSPVEVGPWLLYAAPRSSQNFSMLEMFPSLSTENQYVTADITQHLPTFFSGTCRFAVSSSVSALAVFGSSTELNSLYAYEYMWDGQAKRQQAWHRWDFKYPIVTAYFSGSSVVVVSRIGSYLVASTISPKGNRTLSNGPRTSFLDVQVVVPVVSRVVTVPAWFTAAVPVLDCSAVYMAVATGDMAGSRVGFTYEAGVFTTVPSFTDGTVTMGFPYTSKLAPSPPFRKDYKGVRVSTNKMTVLRFDISTNQSGPFTISVGDAVPDAYEDAISPVFYNSPELVPGQPVVGSDSTVVVPARTRAESTVLTMSSEGVDEFNLVGLEFVAQYHEKLRRATQ